MASSLPPSPPPSSYNRLKTERSLYLKQSQDHPVHWWPFGPEPLLKAKEDNLPILLSIGHSSSHWCHIMGQECFSHQAWAQFLNQNFVNIIVDRDEFPDLDQFFQKILPFFGHPGGWPLTAFLTPDLKPYFVGTYFPPEPEEGRGVPGFPELIRQMASIFQDRPQFAEEVGNKVLKALEEGHIAEEMTQIDQDTLPSPTDLWDIVRDYTDHEHGGFGEAPKFPHFSFWEWSAEQVLENRLPPDFKNFLIMSMDKMLRGGINDHVKGGFHRYSSDQFWRVPHFEKMLYDQAGLLKCLSKWSLVHPTPLVFDSLFNTLHYLESEMTSADQCFFSSQDADSEGPDNLEEGPYFVFTEEEFQNALAPLALSQEEYRQVKEWFGITAEGNFRNGYNVLSLTGAPEEGLFSSQGWELVRKALRALKNERRERLPPPTDTKGIASWNFQILTALTDVIQYSSIEPIRQAGLSLFQKTLLQTEKHYLKKKGTSSPFPDPLHEFAFHHTTTQGWSLPYLEDYVFYGELQLRAYEITAHFPFRERAKFIARLVLEEFFSEGKLLTRGKRYQDHVPYPNEQIRALDIPYKSPASTFLLFLRRLSILAPELSLGPAILDLKDVCFREVWFNPVHAGEALRATADPDEAYGVLRVPKTWVDHPTFWKIHGQLPTRMIVDYWSQDNNPHGLSDQDGWQVHYCPFAPEDLLQGKTMEELVQLASQYGK